MGWVIWVGQGYEWSVGWGGGGKIDRAWGYGIVFETRRRSRNGGGIIPFTN